MAEYNVKNTQKTCDGKRAVITRVIEEIVTEVDVLQKINQLQYKLTDIKKQMEALSAQYTQTLQDIDEQQQLLNQFNTGMPTLQTSTETANTSVGSAVTADISGETIVATVEANKTTKNGSK